MFIKLEKMREVNRNNVYIREVIFNEVTVSERQVLMGFLFFLQSLIYY